MRQQPAGTPTGRFGIQSPETCQSLQVYCRFDAQTVFGATASKLGNEGDVVRASLSRGEIALLLVVIVITPILFLVLLYISMGFDTPFFWSFTVWVVLGGSALGAGFGFTVVGTAHVSAIRFGSSEVSIETWFSKSRFVYSAVRPVALANRLVGFQIRWVRSNGQLSELRSLSPLQARALLVHPMTPGRLFPPEEWKRVGLTPPSDGDYLFHVDPRSDLPVRQP